MIRVLTLGLVGLVGACSVVHGGTDFENDEGCDFELKLRDFSPHVTDKVTAFLSRVPAEGMERRVEAVAIFDPLGSANVDLRMPNGVRPRTSTAQSLAAIDFYADFDDIEGFSFPGDHTWFVEDACTTGPELFLHNTDFAEVRVPLAAGTSVSARRCGLTRVMEGAIELRVIRLTPTEDPDDPPDEVIDQAIGFYRLDDLARAPEAITIPQIANTDFDMRIEIVLDADRDGVFDSTDEAWSFTHRRDSPVRCASIPQLDETLCPRPTAVLTEPLPACLTPSGDVIVIISPLLTRENGTSTLSSPSWFQFAD